MIYVGIDVASQKHDYYMISDQGEIYTSRSITITNNDEGYKKLHKSIQEFCGATKDYKVRIGLESTGFYHKNLVSYLLANKYEVMVINPLLTNMYKKSRKIHIQKNDNIDSIYICKYLMDTETVFKPYTTISYHTETLKALSRERFSLVEELRLAKININKLLTQIFPEFLKLFSNVYQGSALDILEKYNSPSKLSKAHLKTISSMIHGKCLVKADELIKASKRSVGIKDDYLTFQLSQGIKRLKSIQSTIDEYNNQISKYVNMINPNILTISGVGYITAGLILGEIGDINNFKNSEHLISYAGLDVKIYESGKYKATNLSISKKGSVYLRYALYQVAKVCWKFDQMFNAYYLKKKAENKHYYVILGHIEKKLVKVIYSVLKKNKPYSPQI
jgi:transposase